jgi:hypothetical protein
MQAAQKFCKVIFNLKRLKDAAIKEEYQVKITNGFAAFENLGHDDVDLGIRENMKASAKESLGY